MHVFTSRASHCRYTMKVTKECPVTVQLSTSKHDVYFKLEVCSATYLYYFCSGFTGLVGSFFFPNTNSHCRCLTEMSRSPRRRAEVMGSFPSTSYTPQPSWRRRGGTTGVWQYSRSQMCIAIASHVSTTTLRSIGDLCDLGTDEVRLTDTTTVYWVYFAVVKFANQWH